MRLFFFVPILWALCVLRCLSVSAGSPNVLFIAIDDLNNFALGNHPDAKIPAIATHSPGNHAVQSACWRYIRYANDSEELYDHRTDPHEFTNLAGQSRYADIIRQHAVWLPKGETALDPVYRVPEKYRPPKE